MNAPLSSSVPVSAFAPPRVTPNVAHAWGGIWRLTARRHFTSKHWLLLGGMLVLLALFATMVERESDPGRSEFLQWAARFYMSFLVPMLAFITAAGAMRDDLQADSVDYIFTRPVRRPLYVLFRYAAHFVCAQLDFLAALVVIVAVGAFHNVPGLWAAVPAFLLAQVLVVTAFSAFGFLCGMITSRYVILGMVYAGVFEVGIGNVPTQLNRLSMLRQMFGLLEPVIGPEHGSSGLMVVSTLGAPATVGLLLTYALLMLGATVALFSVKEFAGNSRDA